MSRYLFIYLFNQRWVELHVLEAKVCLLKTNFFLKFLFILSQITLAMHMEKADVQS